MFTLRRVLKVFFLPARFWLTDYNDGYAIEIKLVTWMIYTSSDNVLFLTDHDYVIWNLYTAVGEILSLVGYDAI
jgi:hypothetical protein